MTTRWPQLAFVTAGLGLLATASAPGAFAEPAPRMSLQTSGTVVGVVSDAGGVGQMGATVLLFNRFEKLVQRVLTNERGQFGFDKLIPDSYTIRVSLPSFVPAIRSGILVQPGMRSVLSINMASVLSSVELIYSSPNPPHFMADDWKWVLRSSMSSRPVLRFLPSSPQRHETVFTNTRGLVRVSAGDGMNSWQGGQPDLGTAFAVATSLFGVNNLQVSGNVGYASRAGLPVASFRTRYSRNSADNGLPFSSKPEVQLTVRQSFLPAHGFSNGSSSAPSISTMSGLVLDRVMLTDGIELLYGAQMESVSYYERLNILSPFARLHYRVGAHDSLQVAWSSGAAPDELYLSSPASTSDFELQNGLSTLSAFPRVSMRAGHAHVQRMEQMETSYHHDLNSKTELSVAAYYENVANAALAAIGDTGDYSTREMLPDIFSPASVFNIGSYQRRGLMVLLSRELTSRWSAQVAYGNSGTMRSSGQEVVSGDADSLRSALQRTQQNWMSVRVSGAIPGSGTRFTASYLLTDDRGALPAHRYLTQRFSPDLGLNMQVRQPIPSFGMWAGRVEAVAELRNVLQQGYLPVQASGGRRVVLVPSPKTVRGGLAFIF